uniref:Uncharacterized protein n=1 Tax=Spongospora subterranea TaxID=70186 RepID=A0A0H5QV76_9EUKA|eukprot:CRZ05657.1 hypothetical protein [Spongospora subterranea]
MTNVPDMVIVGVVAAVGALVVAASFSRNISRRRRKPKLAPQHATMNKETQEIQVITARREMQSAISLKVKSDNRIHNGAALVFYDMLVAYSSVAVSSPSTNHHKVSMPEPIYSTWARHEASGEDQIIITSASTKSEIPYSITESGTMMELPGTVVSPVSLPSGGRPASLQAQTPDCDQERLRLVDLELKALRQRMKICRAVIHNPAAEQGNMGPGYSSDFNRSR